MSPTNEDYFRYVPIRQRDVDWGLYVTGAGYTAIPAGFDAYPLEQHPATYEFTWEDGRRLPEYQIIYITAGGGEFESPQTGPLQLSAGTLILLFPNVWHRYRPLVETGWDEYWVSFAGETMDRLVTQGFFSPGRAIMKIGIQDEILGQFKAVLKRLKEAASGFSHRIAADTLEILATMLAIAPVESAELVARGPREVATVSDRLVADALRVIWDETQEVLTVADLANRFPVGRRSLERHFRDALGHTVHDEILRCRLDRARRLLANTDLAIKDVAAAAGFPNADNMGRSFRKNEGQSPGDYRRKHKKA